MTHYIIFTADVQATQISKLRQAITESVNGGAKEIYLAISSNGGIVVEGIAIAALLRSLQINVITHNIGLIDSVANVIFAAGKQRFANKTSSFMFHGVSQNFNGSIAFSESQLWDLHKNTVRLRESIAENVSTYTGIVLTDISSLMISGDTILKSSEALTRKIIDGIKDFSIPAGSKIISIGNV